MKKSISTMAAPAAIGPYSQANILGNLVFISGQIPVSPETGNLVNGGIEVQTRQVFKNIGAILEAAGSDFDHVVKTTVFLAHMDDFSAMNNIYAEYFKEGSYPSRSAIQAGKLPKGALIEIEVIAEVKGPAYIKL